MRRLPVGRRAFLVSLALLFAVIGALVALHSHPKTAYQKPAMWIPAPSGLGGRAVPVRSGTATAVADTPSKVHIVRELTAKRRSSSITYLLSNGLNETHFFGAPVNYKIDNGDWKRIDTQLVRDSSGNLHTAATPGSLTLAAKTGSAAPVHLASQGRSLAIDVTGLNSDHLNADKSSATYADAAPGVSLTYTALSTGVEQIISLASAAAGNRFTCTVASPGLSLRATGEGQWAFFAPGARTPKFFLSNFIVTDSAGGPEGDPAVCPGATIAVHSAGGISRLTYTVPRSWMADPARVYPVKIDPTFFYPIPGDPPAPNAQYCDTYITQGAPTTSHAPAVHMYTGYNAIDNYSWGRSLLAFDLSPLTGTSIQSASLNLYKYSGGASSDSVTVKVATMAKPWGPNAKWSNTGAVANSFPTTFASKPFATDASVPTASWMTVTTTPQVQAWASGLAPNYGFLIYQSEASSQADNVYKNLWYGVDNGSYQPYLSVTYLPVKVVAATATSSDNGSGWLLASGGNDDGNTQGRGAVNLSWPASVGADGYAIYLYDGLAFDKVGQTVGNASTSWSSAGKAFYPKDSEIAAASWPGGSAGNPFYRAATPTDNAQIQLAQPSTYSGSAGLLAGNGTYLYARARNGQSGPTGWQKINPNANPVTSVFLGGPNNLNTTKPALSAFYYNSRIYSAYVTKGGSTATITGVQTASPYGDGGTITFSTLPLERNTGAAITANSGTVLLATDGTNIFNLSYTLTTSGGNPVFDGFKIRKYTMTGTFVSDMTVSMPSFMCSHMLVDGNAIYLCQWTTANGKVLKINKSTGAVISQWTEDQATTQVCAGFCDITNNVIWLGNLTTNKFYKYAGAAGGLDLRDNPSALYAKMSGNSQAQAYEYYVTPYSNSGGELPLGANTPVFATLDARTVPTYNEPTHTVADLGGFADNALSVRLDVGLPQVSVTDLAIAWWGPAAEVWRTYLPTNSSTGYFAPGWRFNFEQGLANITSSGCDFVDAAGDAHHFVLAGGVWTSPNGMQATLTNVGSTYTLTYLDKTVLTFAASGSSATLSSERDRNANQVTYTRTSSQITIAAANGQQIVVALSAGKVTSAVYTTTAGTRQVNFTTAPPWQVTSYPGTSAQRVVSYAYDATPRLTSITAKDWPQSGQNAVEQLVYASNKLSEVQSPGYNATTKPELHKTINYATSTATVTSYGRVNDVANTAVPEVFTWNTLNAPITDTVGSGGSAATTTYTYSANGELANTLEPGGTAQTEQSVTASGVLLASYDENNDPSVNTYTDANNPDSPTTEGTGVGMTWNIYSTAGNLTESVQLLVTNGDSADYADTQNAYDTCGRLTMTKTLVSGTVTLNKDANGNVTSTTITNGVWNETDYSNFAANGQPQTTVNKAVKVSDAAAPQDLTATTSYDAFGDLLTQTDTSGTRTTQTNTYDIAGQQLTTTDAMGLVTASSYDTLGNVIETYQTHAGSAMKANWSKITIDITSAQTTGMLTTETKLLSDSNGVGTTQSVVTTVCDGLGNLVSRNDSTVGGQPEKWTYDLRGNTLKHWEMGVADYSDTRATACGYDQLNQLASETAPGDSAATSYTYDAAGNTTKQTNPDGSFVASSYDHDGNLISSTQALAGYDPVTNPGAVATSGYAYDLAGHTVTSGDATTSSAIAPGMTVYGYDAAGNQIAATGYFDATYPTDSSGATTATSINVLGWVLSTPDANGMTTVNTYDTAGRLTSQRKGNQQAVVFVYDDVGHIVGKTMTDPNSTARVLAGTYDNYENQSEVRHTVAGTIVKDTTTTFDSLSRPTSSSESVSGLTHIWSYPVNTAPSPTTVFETVGYDGLPATRVRLYLDARNLESKRVTTINGTDYTRTVDARDYADRLSQATFDGNLTSGFSFDAVGRVKRQWGAGYQSGAASADAYAFDSNTAKKTIDNLLLATVGSFGTIAGSYTYDANQRLNVANVNGVNETDTFDNSGNISQVLEGGVTTTFSYNTADQITSSVTGSVTTVYGWDTVNGSRTSQGPSTTPNQVQYTYTASGQLASYSDSSRGITSTYSYDASGQRTKSLVVQGTQTTTTTYVYEGLTLLELSATYTDSNNPGNNTSWRIDYLSDENDRPYGGTYRLPASSTSPTLFCLVTSDRGDIVELTDSAGNAFCGYHYDAWGNPQGGTGGIQSQATGLLTAALAGQIASRQVLRYAGYAYDTESGLYYCSARSYDPLTRQFVSIDSAKAEGEKSAYQYCGGNPVGNTDPSGRYLDPGCGDGSGGSSSHGWHNTWVRVWIPAYWTYHWDIVGYIRKYDWRKIVEIPDYRHLFKSADDFALKMFNDLAGNPATWDYLNIRCRPDAPVDSSDPTYVHNWSELKTHSDWFDWIKEWGRTNQCQYWRPLNGDRSYLVFDAYWKWNSGHVVEHVFLGVEKYIVSKTPIWRYVKWVYYAGKYAWKLERKWV